MNHKKTPPSDCEIAERRSLILLGMLTIGYESRTYYRSSLLKMLQFAIIRLH